MFSFFLLLNRLIISTTVTGVVIFCATFVTFYFTGMIGRSARTFVEMQMNILTGITGGGFMRRLVGRFVGWGLPFVRRARAPRIPIFGTGRAGADLNIVHRFAVAVASCEKFKLLF